MCVIIQIFDIYMDNDIIFTYIHYALNILRF